MCCRFRHLELFAGVSFRLAAGQTLWVRGANGSGKTTLLRVLAGLRPAQEGEIAWNGRPAGAAGGDYFRRVCYLGHRDGVKAGLTARENLVMQSLLAGQADAGERQGDMLAAARLSSSADAPAARLSRGQSRRLALTRLPLGDRAVWILDEPLTALDSGGRAWFADMLRAHRRRGGLAVIATHEAAEEHGGDRPPRHSREHPQGRKSGNPDKESAVEHGGNHSLTLRLDAAPKTPSDTKAA